MVIIFIFCNRTKLDEGNGARRQCCSDRLQKQGLTFEKVPKHNTESRKRLVKTDKYSVIVISVIVIYLNIT